MSSCQHIDQVVKLSELEGNSVLNISKSELMDEVIWMNNPLSSNLRQKAQSIKELQYEKTRDLPHDPATEYFICNECKVVIIFPITPMQQTVQTGGIEISDDNIF